MSSSLLPSLAVLFILAGISMPAFAQSPSSGPATPRVLLTEPPWPTVFELDCGQSFVVTRGDGERAVCRVVRLVSVEDLTLPMMGLKAPDGRLVCGAKVTVEVDGRRAELFHRAYAMPETVNGLRLFVECTRGTAGAGELANIKGLAGEVRLSAVGEGESWGPPTMRFPIENYRWRSSSYNNSWQSLVPQGDLVYFHRGEDFGAIPERLGVRSVLDGSVTASPLKTPGGSNTVRLRVAANIEAVYAHMDTESIAPRTVPGEIFAAGEKLGKTGSTWNGKKSQYTDPHLHFAINLTGPVETQLATYPFLVEAYLRDYPDELLPVAGGYVFGLVGEEVLLDGRRSLSRDGRTIRQWRWRLSDGTVRNESVVRVKYDKPGYYSEELTVVADDGREDRDFAQVRVFAKTGPQSAFCGFLHYAPVRGVKPGMEVLFWNRLWTGGKDATIDFGDGTPQQSISQSATHAYARSGIYTVTLTGLSPAMPVTVKTRVVVE